MKKVCFGLFLILLIQSSLSSSVRLGTNKCKCVKKAVQVLDKKTEDVQLKEDNNVKNEKAKTKDETQQEDKSVVKDNKKNKDYLWDKLKDFEPKKEKHFVVLIPSYNNSKWYQKNLDSIFAQKYNNYHILYIDDCSPDGTGDLVEKYVKEKGQEHRFILVKNKERRKAMANVYAGVCMCDDSDIVATCDGDDWWMGENVLSLLNKIYQFDVWMTHGSVYNWPDEKIVQLEGYSADVVEKNDFRDHGWLAGGLRSFYAWLFKKIKIEDLKIDGQFLSVSHDVAIMFPMFEMAGKRHKFIPDPLYVSNRATGINDFTLYSKAQRAIEQYIRYVKPKYTPLKENPFEDELQPQNINIQDVNVTVTATVTTEAID